MISVYIGYDTASVDCMNIAVCCLRKAVKFNHSLTAYDNVVIAESADDDLAPIFVGTRASAVTMIAQDGRCPNVGIMLKMFTGPVMGVRRDFIGPSNMS